MSRVLCGAAAAALMTASLAFAQSPAHAQAFEDGTPVVLTEHEQSLSGYPGHTLERHVAWSVADLVNRCATQTIRNASTFYNEGDANYYVNQVIYKESTKLKASISNNVRGVVRVPGLKWGYWWSSTGQIVNCKTSEALYARGVQVILDPLANAPGGWFVLTAYPMDPGLAIDEGAVYD